MEENNVLHAQDITGTVPNICSAVLMVLKHGKLLLFQSCTYTSWQDSF